LAGQSAISSVSARGGPAYGWGRIKMFSIYILKSCKNGKKYTGFTSKNPEQRLKEHNSGSNKFTRRNGPFVLFYTEAYYTKIEAIKRENFLKSGAGRNWIKNNISRD